MITNTYKSDCYSFQYHPHLFGAVTITDIVSGKTIEVSGNDLLNFIDNFIKEQKIYKLQNAKCGEILEDVINN